jgi:SpoVK/Ycf46/Vps4 family AAA+-type ATPase
MPPKTPKPYIKSAKKVEFHIAENTGDDVQQILDELGKFLKSIGFLIPTKKKKKKIKQEKEMDTSVDQQIGNN